MRADNPSFHWSRLPGWMLLSAALPLAAQTWFELDHDVPPAGQMATTEAWMEADLDTLQQGPDTHRILVRVSWSEPRPLAAGAPARSVQALVELSCPTALVRWTQPRFFSERQAQGMDVTPPAEVTQALQASDWLPVSGQAKLLRSACGRQPLRSP